MEAKSRRYLYVYSSIEIISESHLIFWLHEQRGAHKDIQCQDGNLDEPVKTDYDRRFSKLKESQSDDICQENCLLIKTVEGPAITAQDGEAVPERVAMFTFEFADVLR